MNTDISNEIEAVLEKPTENNLKVLHVEDNRVDAMLISAILNKIDDGHYLTRNIASLTELEQCECVKEYDVILLDLTLPECQGMETLRRVHALFSDIAIVIISGNPSDGLASQAISYGAQDYLVKGHIVPEVLMRTIRFAIKRKQLEAELQESKNRFLLAVDGANDGIWDWPDVNSDQYYWSPRLKELLGYEDHQLFANADTLATMIHPLDYYHFKDTLLNHLKNNLCFDIELRLKHKSRQYRWYHVKGKAIRDETGYATRLTGSLSDIHNRKQDEHTIKELYAVTIDKSFSLADKAKKILEHATDYLNMSFGIINQQSSSDTDILYAYSRDINIAVDTYATLDAHMASSLIKAGEVLCLPDSDNPNALDNSALLEAHQIYAYIGMPLYVNGKIYGVLNFYDTTQRLFTFSEREKTFMKLASQWIASEIERDIFLKTQKRLEEARRLESVGQLAAGVAHEINTPTQFVGDNLRFVQQSIEQLNTLLTYIQHLSQSDTVSHQALTAEVAHLKHKVDIDFVLSEIPLALSQSLDGLQRIKAIVKAMKNSVHPDNVDMQLADINQEIQSACVLSRSEWKLVCNIEMHLDENLPKVYCLPFAINQVVLNMLINASHAIADAVKAGRYEKGLIKISTKAMAEYAEIHIIDNGSGIPKAAQPKIFDPFFTTKEVGVGTGQGMSLAYNVINDKHKGVIDFESEEGVGTHFTIKIPNNAQDASLTMKQTQGLSS